MEETKDYSTTKDDFVHAVYGAFSETTTEVEERNAKIDERDEFIYGERLEQSIDVPVGHDFTPVNWLRRTVEIHKNMFMGRPFQVVSTYDSLNLSTAADQEDQQRLQLENKKLKEYAEARKNMIDAIIIDNGGHALFSGLAESASAIGDAAIKTYYDEEDEKFVISPIESVENLYVIWGDNDFRDKQAIAYAYQVSKEEAIEDFDAPEDVPTSSLGHPFTTVGYVHSQKSLSNQKMVTIMEVTGKIPGWSHKDGKCVKVKAGEETDINCVIVGNQLRRVTSDPKKLPKYYILPNKRQRKRAWGMSDVSDAAININVTYIETLSDWRTLASKVNFQKYKAFGFGQDTQLPKYESRKVQVLNLTEGQDIQPLDNGDANRLDFQAQMEELKEQYVRETGISRVLFDDPSVTLNSNQALLTSMKPTSDIAEAKKQLWAPVLTEMFADALETIALFQPKIKDLVGDDNFTLKIMWPSVMQKEDPIYQQMLLNRFNAGTMSIQSFMEAQGESKEEIDRLRDELTDPVTAAVHGKQVPLIAQTLINAATAEIQAWYQSIVAPPEMPNQEGIDSNGGVSAPNIQATPAENQEGMGVMSQPGSGATPVGAQGALNQVTQNNGG